MHKKMEEKAYPKSVYSSGAHDGALMGAVFIAVFCAMAYGSTNGSLLLSLAATVSALAVVPALLYIMMRRRFVEEKMKSPFFTVWMHGITIMICGNLILGLGIYLYLRFLNPYFLINQVTAMADIYGSMGTPEATQIADTFQKMIDMHLLPSPISFAFSCMWFGSFLGTVLALIITSILRLIPKKNIV